jgi:ATP-dependent helicase HrpB
VRDEAVVSPDGLCLVLDAKRGGPGKPAMVHLGAPLSIDALIEGRGEAITDEEEMVFDTSRGRVESVARLRYGRLVLEETRGAAPASEAATRALLDEVFRRGLALVGGKATEAWLKRARFAARNDDTLPSFDDEALRARLSPLTEGMTRLDELSAAGLDNLLALGLAAEHRARIERLAPERLRLASGQWLAITYPDAAPPFVESYLQDFFGLERLPTVGGEAMVVKLWAPNGRPMQVTDDLPGFWERLYPELRRELGRRYPKHNWPTDPTTAPPVRLKRHLS